MSEAQQPTSLQEEVNLRPEPISFAEFLEDIPPSQERDVKDLGTEPLTQFTMKLNTPELRTLPASVFDFRLTASVC
jgi:hypothetical protein